MESKFSNLQDFMCFFLRSQKWKVFGILFLILLISFFTVIDPYLLKIIIDQITSININEISLKNENILKILILFLVLGLLNNIAWRFINYLSLKVFPLLKVEVFSKTFNYISLHNYQYFQENLAGDLANKVQNIVDGIEEIFLPSLNMIYILFTVLITICVVFTINIYFSIVLLFWVMLFVFISFKLSKKIKNYSKNLAQVKSTLNGRYVDSLMNIFNVSIFARQKFEKEYLNNFAYKVMEQDIHLRWYLMTLWFVQAVLCTLIVCIMISILIYLFSKNMVTSGDLVFIISSTTNITYHIFIIAELISKVIEKVGVCNQALSVLYSPHTLIDKGDKKIQIDQGIIEFKGVSFIYGESNKIFKNLNLIINAKQKLGLVGYSGGGKTTLINLILRLYDLQGGVIEIDNYDIKDVSMESLRENIALIPQNPILFHRSIMENIRYGRIEATDDEVIEASKKAYVDDFIKEFEHGYHSLIGENGVKLSGGQRQRIAIARAILKNAPILILDEATSSLDSITEGLIQDSLKELMQNKTVIVIAHRISTLFEMDRIIVLNNGEVVEDGAHEDLINYNGLYANIYNTQVNGFLPMTK